MIDSLALFKARSQLMAHAIGCLCAPCRDARKLVDDAAAERRRDLYAAGEQWMADNRDDT